MYGIAGAAGTEHPRGCMLGNTATERTTDDAAISIVRTAFAELESDIAHALERAQSDGEVTPAIDPDIYARVLVATMQGLHVLARVETEPQRLRESVDAVLGRLATIPS
jgi:TetR/AcrR family transcriptional repressor of nem operon